MQTREVRRIPRIVGEVIRGGRRHAHGSPPRRGQGVVHVWPLDGNTDSRAAIPDLQAWRFVTVNYFLFFLKKQNKTCVLLLVIYTCVNPFRTKTPKYLFLRGGGGGGDQFYHQIGNTNFFIFITNQYNFDVLCTQNEIWTFGLPFRSKKLPIFTQNSDLQSLYHMLPIWAFTDYFA